MATCKQLTRMGIGLALIALVTYVLLQTSESTNLFRTLLRGHHTFGDHDTISPKAPMLRPGAWLDVLQSQISSAETRLVLCLEQDHWVSGQSSDASKTLPPHDISADVLRNGICASDTRACYSVGTFPRLFVEFLRTHSPIPCFQLAILQAVLQTAMELFQGKTVTGKAATLGQTAQHEGMHGLDQVFNMTGKVAGNDTLSIGSLALSAAATLHCGGQDSTGVCAPSALTSLAQRQLQRLGEAPYGMVLALGAMQQAVLLGNASRRFAGRRHEQCGLLPTETDIVWGPFDGNESFDIHRVVPVLAEDSVASMGSLGSEHVPKVLPRLCGYRFGHVVLLPIDWDVAQVSSPSNLALLAALLSSRETAILVGPTPDTLLRLSDSLNEKYSIQRTNTATIAVHHDTLGGWAAAEAAALKALRAANATYVVSYDLRDSPGPQVLDSHQSAQSQGVAEFGVAQNRAGLAQLRLQLCKWHPAAGVVGSPTQEQQSHSDGYSIVESLMQSSVVAYDMNVVQALMAPHGSGSVLDVLGAAQPVRTQVRHQIRAVRAALLAAFYADYTMVLPHVQSADAAKWGGIGGQALADAVIGLKARMSSELVAKQGDCGLNIAAITKAMSTVACLVSGAHVNCSLWRACRRIGNGYMLAAHSVRSCYSNSSSIVGHLAKVNQSFLVGAAYTPSTAGAGACIRTAMGLFGLFSNYGTVGITQAFFVEPQLRPHVVFVLPPRSDAAPFVRFVPGSVAFNRETKPSLGCWAQKQGHPLEEWIKADSQSVNMLTGLTKNADMHAVEQYRDHDAIRSMIDLTELSYEITHDYYIIQRADIAWLRSPLPATPEWNTHSRPLSAACLIAGTSIDWGGVQDRVATCDRQGFNAFTSAAALFREKPLQAVVESCHNMTGNTNAENFLKYRLLSANIRLTREGDIFARVCSFSAPKPGQPLQKHERRHKCFWRPEVQMWVTDVEHGAEFLKPVQAVFQKEVEVLNRKMN